MKVIAEIGSNWRSLNDCHESIIKAKEAGAWAVKFQLFTPNSLYGPNEKFDLSQLGMTPYLHPHWIPHLAKHATDLDLEFMCTAFSPREYEIVNEHVNYHKIASAELTDISILKKVNSFKKPVFLSTGGSDIHDEIRNALLYLRDCDVTIMYCVADYPAKIIDFKKLKQMQYEFGDGYDYGYSDHSLDLLNIPRLAKEAEATVLEKHVRLSNILDTPDASHSCTFDELKLMIDHLNGSSFDSDKLANNDMRRLWKRRFVAITPIEDGERFRLGVNMGIYRAKVTAEDPVITFRHFDIEGKKSRVKVNKGDVICYHHIGSDD